MRIALNPMKVGTMKTKSHIPLAERIQNGELLDYIDLRLSSAHLRGLADGKTHTLKDTFNFELNRYEKLKYHISDYIYSSIALKFLDNNLDIPEQVYGGLGFAPSTLTKAELAGIRMEAAAHYYATVADCAYIKSNFSLASDLLERAIDNYTGTIDNWETNSGTKWNYSLDTLGKTIMALESKFSKMHAKLYQSRRD